MMCEMFKNRPVRTDQPNSSSLPCYEGHVAVCPTVQAGAKSSGHPPSLRFGGRSSFTAFRRTGGGGRNTAALAGPYLQPQGNDRPFWRRIGFDGNTPLTPVVVASGLINPEGLAFEKEGSLPVVESGASRLSRIDLSTGEATMIVDGLELGGPGQEGMPPTYLFDGAAIGLSGDFYISDGNKNILYRVSEE